MRSGMEGCTARCRCILRAWHRSVPAAQVHALLLACSWPALLPPLAPRRWIATYANARTALQARKGIAPAFMAGERSGG